VSAAVLGSGFKSFFSTIHIFYGTRGARQAFSSLSGHLIAPWLAGTGTIRLPLARPGPLNPPGSVAIPKVSGLAVPTMNIHEYQLRKSWLNTA